jgi:hypothetical protein
MRTEIKTRDGEVLSFWAPDAGGYVYRETDDRPCQLGVQVCDGLAERGSTLRWRPSMGEFAAFIRAERARGLRKARREANPRTWR